MIESIRKKTKQLEELTNQLERQLDFEARYGVVAHNIKSIRVRASGYPNVISYITMKDGTLHTIRGIDAKVVLDGVSQ